MVRESELNFYLCVVCVWCVCGVCVVCVWCVVSPVRLECCTDCALSDHEATVQSQSVSNTCVHTAVGITQP